MAKGRYIDTNVILTDDNKPRFTSTFYPEISKLTDDTYIIANTETRLDLLARDYYGDVGLYWIIGVCNSIEGTIFMEPGTQICIPNRDRLPGILSSVKVLNK